MRWPGIETIYGPTLRTTTVFVSGVEGEGDKRWEDLHTRVIEHVSLRSINSTLRVRWKIEKFNFFNVVM